MPVNQSASSPSHEQIRAQLDRILASKLFVLSKRQSAFLHYVINAQLDGRAEKLKEYALGVDVFARDESFDPGVESIVRVEASRLRAKLREYYDGEGAGDLVRIDIPKGHYVPVFRFSKAPDARSNTPPRWSVWIGLVIATLVIAIFYISFRAPIRDTNLAVKDTTPPAPSSIAVLPLRDWSTTPEEYFGVAMTDTLISELASQPALRVTSLTSVMQYQDTKTPIPEIGRALDVAYILEGSIFRDDESIRITAQLISAPEDEHVWSATFDRPMQDILPMQSEVATAIAAQISDELRPISKSSTPEVNQAAHTAYMKGRYFSGQFTEDGFVRGMDFFQRAIEIQPDYAEAYAGLASCHCLMAGHGLELVSPIVAIPEAHSLAMKALSLDADMAEPTAFIGIINFKYGWDLEGAELMLNRAIGLNPSLFQAYVWHSQILEAIGQNDDAVDRARYAKQLNPLSLAANLNLGWQMYQAGKYIEAESEIDALIEFDPEFWGGHWARGHIYNQHGMYKKGIDEFQKAIELEGGHSLPMAALGYTFAIAGMPDQARRVIAELEDLSKEVYVSPFHVATIYAGLNEADLMFEWLERAYQVRARSLAWLHVTRELEPYRNDARYQDLLARIGIFSSSDEEDQPSIET